MAIPTQHLQFGDDQNYYIYRDVGTGSTNSNDISFTTDGFSSNVLRISDKDLKFHGEGSLFICETESHTPKAQLHIKKIDPVIILQDLETDPTKASAIIRMANSTGTEYDINDYWDISVGITNATDTFDFQIGKNDTQNTFVIKDSGKIGIGTDVPSTLFSLYPGQNEGLSIKTQNNANNNGIYWQQSDSYYSAGIIRTSNGSNSDLIFATGNSSTNNLDTTALGERMRITSVGSIGIGTTIPVSTLHVDGILSTREIRLIDTPARIYGNAELDNLYVPVSGNIGIGITNPNVSLQIETTNAIKIPVGTTAQRPPTVQVGQIRYNSTKGHYEGYFPDSKWRNIDGLYDFDMKTRIVVDENNDERKIRFYTNDNFRMIIDQIGNIGIGTNDPKVLFHIEGTDALKVPVGTSAERPFTTQLGQIRYNSELNMYEGFGAGSAWNSLGGVIDIDQDTKITVETNQNDEDKIRFFTATTQKMIIDEIGNIGIGITAPTYQLHIKDKIRASGIDIIAGTATASTNGYSFSFESQNGGAVSSGNNTNGGDINIMAGEKGTGGTAGTGIAGIIKTRGHIIPESSGTYDIGSSSKKYRDIFINEGSLWLGDECQIAISGGTNNTQSKKVSFRKRDKSIIPKSIRRFLTKTGTSDKPTDSDQITEFNNKTIDQVDLNELIDFMRDKTGYDNPFNDPNYYHPVTGELLGLVNSTGAGQLVTDDMDTTAAWLENKDKVYYNQTGNVGIGTNDPLTKFHVVGSSTSFTNGQGNDEGIFIIPENSVDQQGGGQIFFKEKHDGSYGFSIGYNGSDTDNTILGWPANTFNFTRHDNNMVGNVIMTMQRKTGYVGIGSVYPEFQLEVYPDTDAVANIGKLRVGHIGVTGSGGISHFDNATTTNFGFRQEREGNTFLNAPRGKKVHMSLDNVPKLTLDMDYVGIGITTPSSLFSVYGGDDESKENNSWIAKFGSKVAVGKWVGIGLNTYHENNIKNGIILERDHTYGRGKLHFCLNNDDDIHNVGIIDTKMTITREGRVGIGVSRPSYLLDLQDIPGGSTTGNIRFRSGFNASTYHLFRMDTTHQSASYSIYDRYGNESIKFHASETCWITGDTNGAKLGIGTSTNIDAAIHIYQPEGAIRTSGSGSIVLEHGTTGEKKSSIVFSSAANTTDYGYLEFIDEDNTYTYWGNGTSNSSLTLGCKLHDDTSNAADVVVMKGVAANIFDAENHLFMTGPVGVGVTGSLKYRLTVSTNSNDVSFANVQEQFCLAMRNINRTNNNMTTIGNFNDLDVVNSSISFQNVDQTNNYGDIVFSTRSTDNKTDAFLTERVRIQNTGKVGIGTNNPSGWLTIKNVPSSNSEKLLVFSEDNDDEFFFESGFYTVGSDKETIKLKTKWGHYAMAWSGNGNVGIGVTTPEFPLEVTYSSNYDYSWGMNIRNKDTTSTTSQRGNMIVFSDVNSIQAGLGAYRENFNTNRRSGLAFLVGDEPEGHVDYHTASTALINQSISEKMRLTPDGRLGIGTKTPETTLHVQGDSTFYGHLLPGANNTYDLGSATKQFRHFYLSPNSTFLDGTKVGYWMNLTDNEFTHETGKVGIGTNSPNAQLHVQAAGAFSANEILQRWAYKNSSNNHRGIALTGPASDNDGNPFIFTTNNALKFVVDSNDVLTLDSLCNVGIGNSTPSYKLDVTGTGRFTDNLTCDSDFIVDTNKFFVDQSTGNVGIGTNSPPRRLVIADQDNVYLRFARIGTDKFDWDIGAISGGSLIFNGGADAGNNTSGLTEKMRIDSSGNVGIGESSPSYKLDVNGIMRTTDNARINETWIGNWNSDDNYAQFTHHSIKDTISSYALMQDSGGNTLLNAANTKVIAFKINAIEKMRLDASGNLGIGHNNPAYRLDVNGTSRFMGDGLYTAGTTSFSVVGSNTGSGGKVARIGVASNKAREAGFSLGNSSTTADCDERWLIGRKYNGGSDFSDIAFFYTTDNGGTSGAGYSEKMRITTGGNLGIGTDNPNQKLSVAGNIEIYGEHDIKFTKTSDGSNLATISSKEYGLELSEARGTYRCKYSLGDASHIWYCGSNTEERMRIDSSGNVGIGTNNPSHKLDVNGEARLNNHRFYSFPRTLDNTTDRYVEIVQITTNYSVNMLVSLSTATGSHSISKMYMIAVQYASGGNAWKIVSPISDSGDYTNNWELQIHNTDSTTKLRIHRTAGTTSAIITCNIQIMDDNATNATVTELTGTGTDSTITNIFESTQITQVNGNVGIGSTAPTYKLDVNGDGRFTQLDVDNIRINNNVISSTANNLKLTPLSGKKIELDGTIFIDAGVVTGATSITSTSFVGDLTGTVITAAQPNITSVGTLGNTTMSGYIGRSAYNSGFLVGGHNNLGNSGGKTNPIYTIGSNFMPTDTTLENMYGIGYTHYSASFIPAGCEWGLYVARSGAIGCFFSGDTTSNSFIMGNLGIGTDSPTEKLDVNGTGKFTGLQVTGNLGVAGSFTPQIHLAIGDNDTGFHQQGDGKLAIYTNNQERVRIQSGNVGIGNSSPSKTLDVTGTARITSDLTVGGNLTISGTTTTVNTTNIVVEDSLIQLASANAADTVDIGMYGKYVSGATTYYTGLVRDASATGWHLFTSQSAPGSTSVSNLSYSPLRTAALTCTTINASGNITGTLVGNAATATTAGTVTTAAQPNITSVGTLTGLQVDGNLGVAGNFTPLIHLAIGDSDTGFKQQGDGELAVYTNNSERVRFDNGGNVGIGDTSPSYKLDVNGTGRFTDDLTCDSDLSVTGTITGTLGTAAQTAITSVGTLTGLQVNGNLGVAGSFTPQIHLAIGDSDTGFKQQGDGKLAIYTNNQERVRIQSGNVGIGNTDPSEKLEVNGNIRGKVYINREAAYAANQNKQIIVASTSDTTNIKQYSWNYKSNSGGTFRLGLVYQSTDSSSEEEYLSIKAGGNVGIGNNEPSYKLDVSGTGRFTGNLTVHSSGEGIKLGNHEIKLTNSGVAHYSIINDDAGYLDFRATGGSENLGEAGTSLMAIKSTGNVGIGTTTPTSKLTVEGSLNLRTGSTDWSLQPLNANTFYITKLGTGGAEFHLISSGNYDECQLKIGGSKIMLDADGSSWFNGGNFGLGTDSPGATLHLGGQNEEIRFGDGATNRSSLVFKGHNTSTTFVDRYAIKSVSGGSSEAHVWYDDTGTAEMTLLNNGNLTVGGDINFTGTLYQNGSAFSSGGAFTESGSEAYYNGNVGIGTNNPAEKLDVNGTIYARGGTALDGGADGNGTECYIRFAAQTSGSDWCMLRQIGTNNNYHMVWDYHDDGSDCDVSWRDIHSSGQNPDIIYTRMCIKGSGNVGIGTASPDKKLHVDGDTYCTGNSYINSNQYFMNNTGYYIHCNGNFYWVLGGGFRMFLDGSGNLTTTGDITGYGSISDVRLKKNIINLDTSISLEKILKIRTVGFKWVDDLKNEKRRGKNDEGLIAQDIEKLWPSLVDEIKIEETDTPYKYIHYDKLTIYLTGAIQEHQKMIENQNKIIEQQQEMINNQQKMMEEFRRELDILKQNI